MTHLSENARKLTIRHFDINDVPSSLDHIGSQGNVCVVVLPSLENTHDKRLSIPIDLLSSTITALRSNSTLIVIGETEDLVHFHASLASSLNYQLWVSIKRRKPIVSHDCTSLPSHHFGAVVYTRYKAALKHTKTRVKYTYCPACSTTTKDYGGKKHTYSSYGTLLSDVWRDISADLDGDLTEVFDRFADLFGVEPYTDLYVLDYRKILTSEKRSLLTQSAERTAGYSVMMPLFNMALDKNKGQLRLGDTLEELGKLPDNSVDFVFADPPYNLQKKYNSYGDDLSITQYFEWCDKWISELIRVLKPGRTCAILNIPIWAIRHFLYMEKKLTFQNWIAWDALSFPVRLIMPAHYSIVCFSKGQSRPLPGLVGESGKFSIPNSPKTFHPLQPLADQYCLRDKCVKDRQNKKINDRDYLTDLWADIHRLKHNSRRVDHPCQLPPHLMYRLISIFTKPDEVVLDCFNGSGTTTLAAHQLERQYIGIELSSKYHEIAESRHQEIDNGYDPFRKEERELTEKNSRVERLTKQTYEVPKKTLQLEVRRVAQLLQRLPSREDMIQEGKYSIKYYDEYFTSWGEVCAAARHDGMSERQEVKDNFGQTPKQLALI